MMTGFRVESNVLNAAVVGRLQGSGIRSDVLMGDLNTVYSCRNTRACARFCQHSQLCKMHYTCFVMFSNLPPVAPLRPVCSFVFLETAAKGLQVAEYYAR